MTDQIPIVDPSRQFYVSATYDETQREFVVLLGPFETHQEALDLVATARRLAEIVDPRACWYAYGTCSSLRVSEKTGLAIEPMRAIFRPKGDGTYDAMNSKGVKIRGGLRP